MQVSSGHPIGCGASSDIIFIMPNTGSTKHPVPKVQLGFPKSCMATQDLVRKGSGLREQIRVAPFLFSKLISCRQHEGFSDLNIVLPLNAITGCFNVRPEREPNQSSGSSQKIPFHHTTVAHQVFR